MILLRVRAALQQAPDSVAWSLSGPGIDPVSGVGPLRELPRMRGRVQLVVPAQDVLITRTRLAHRAGRDSGDVLAFAVEGRTAVEPETNTVIRLGAVGDQQALAVADRSALGAWRAAMAAAGLGHHETCPETLLLPLAEGEWSLAWNGREGFLRTGPFEGGATDVGSADAPPLALRLHVAGEDSPAPERLRIYTTAVDALPDLAAWSQALGLPVVAGGAWDWRSADPDAGVRLAGPGLAWRSFAGLGPRLRPAAWLLATALLVHALALLVDWSLLANEQARLRQQMEAEFRRHFPDAVAVVDPALQMRRKLAEARRANGQPDAGDFLPMLATVVGANDLLPAGSLRVLTYDAGRLHLELAPMPDELHRAFLARLENEGLRLEPAAAAVPGAARLVTVRAP